MAESLMITLISVLGLIDYSHAYMQSFTQTCGANMEYVKCAPICPVRCDIRSDDHCLSRLNYDGSYISKGSERKYRGGCQGGCVCKHRVVWSNPNILTVSIAKKWWKMILRGQGNILGGWENRVTVTQFLAKTTR